MRHAVVSISTNTTYKGVADYKCLDGYWFSKDLFLVSSTCSRNGEWFPIPDQCIREYSFVIDLCIYEKKSINLMELCIGTASECPRFLLAVNRAQSNK